MEWEGEGGRGERSGEEGTGRGMGEGEKECSGRRERLRIEERMEGEGRGGGWVRLGWALPILANLGRKGPGSARFGFVELGQLSWNWLSSAEIGLR